MSKKETTIMKMPENAKLVSVEVEEFEPNSHGLLETAGFSTLLSVNWLVASAGIIGVNVVPSSNGLVAIPAILVVISAFLSVGQGMIFFLEKLPSVILSALHEERGIRPLTKLSSSSSRNGTYDQVVIQSWTRSPALGLAHFLLPFRIFKKIKVHESVTYFPRSDVYIKKTQYLTFRRWIEVEKTFDGHRAVFQKALNSF